MKSCVRIVALCLLAFGITGAAFAQDADVTITIANRGASSWVVTSVEGSSGIARTRTENPEITLRTGVRYRIVNEAARNIHPFELIATNGRDQVLLSQTGAVEGDFEGDPDVDFMEGSRGITFTLTSALMDELNGYRCGIHTRAMRGAITSPGEAAEGGMNGGGGGGMGY